MASISLFCLFFLAVLHVVLAGSPDGEEPLKTFYRGTLQNPDRSLYRLPTPSALEGHIPVLPTEQPLRQQVRFLYLSSLDFFPISSEFFRPSSESEGTVATPKATTAASPKAIIAASPKIPAVPEKQGSLGSISPKPMVSTKNLNTHSGSLRVVSAPETLLKAVDSHRTPQPQSHATPLLRFQTVQEMIEKWGEVERIYKGLHKDDPLRAYHSEEGAHCETARLLHNLCSKMGKVHFIHEFGCIELDPHDENGPHFRAFIELKLQKWDTRCWAPKAKDFGNEEWLQYLSEKNQGSKRI